MQNWLIYGIMAAFFWGSYIVATKIAISEKYFGINHLYIAVFMLVGIAIVFIGNILYQGEFAFPENKLGIVVGVSAGVLWALGMSMSFIALEKGADVAKLAPIYNLNTLIAVVLGILFLHELPNKDELLRVLLGSVMIVIGAILVSL